MSTTFSRIPDDAQLAGRVHAALKDAIVSGRVPPNARLVQERIASEMGVSRTPVREALHLLEREGLVQLLPRRGAIVHGLTFADVRDLYETRLAIEPFAAERGCERATDAERATVERLAAATSNVRNVRAAFSVNRDFHHALCAPSGNAMLMRALAAVWTQQGAPRIFVYQASPGGALAGMGDEHRAIAHAYGRCDARVTRALVHDHIAAAGEDVMARLAEMRDDDGDERGSIS